MTRPRTSGRSLRLRELLLPALLAAGGCAAPLAVPPAAVVEQARKVASYTARLDVSLKGKDVRARTRVLAGFRRPDALRIEVPGPAGARLVAVAAGDRLWAVFPSERAIYTGAARAADFEQLLGLALAPAEVMDLLTGVRSPRLLSYEARWGAALPRRIDATLPDGARLRVTVEDPDTSPTLGDDAFREPAHEGYRALTGEQARALWSR
jgi:hypothetical protein